MRKELLTASPRPSDFGLFGELEGIIDVRTEVELSHRAA